MAEQVYGLILEKELNPRDWSFGGVSGITKDEVLQIDSDWTNYLPKYEPQSNNYFDTYSCVSFGLLNAVEIYLKRKFDEERNFSDRFLATVSKTICGKGNEMRLVAEALRLTGVPHEEYWPFNEPKTCPEYFSEISEDIYLLAKANFLDKYNFRWEWLFDHAQGTIVNALRFSPLPVAVYAGNDKTEINGIIQRDDRWPTHIEVLYGFKLNEYFSTFNTYENKYKKYAWDYSFGAIQRIYLERKTFMPTPPITIPNNVPVQNVFTGEAGFHLDGKIMIFSSDRAENLASVVYTTVMRNGEYVQGIPLTREQWDSFPKMDKDKNIIV